jgi:hypothetical protein
MACWGLGELQIACGSSRTHSLYLVLRHTVTEQLSFAEA